MKIKITAFDADGNVCFEEETKKSYCLSEMEYHIDMIKLKLLNGEIVNILIERIN
jgi:hypothetical protein